MLTVKICCPICGVLCASQDLADHIEGGHQLQGKLVLRLHPSSPYTHIPPAAEPEPEPAAVAEEPVAEADQVLDEAVPREEPVADPRD